MVMRKSIPFWLYDSATQTHAIKPDRQTRPIALLNKAMSLWFSITHDINESLCIISLLVRVRALASGRGGSTWVHRIVCGVLRVIITHLSLIRCIHSVKFPYKWFVFRIQKTFKPFARFCFNNPQSIFYLLNIHEFNPRNECLLMTK